MQVTKGISELGHFPLLMCPGYKTVGE